MEAISASSPEFFEVDAPVLSGMEAMFDYQRQSLIEKCVRTCAMLWNIDSPIAINEAINHLYSVTDEKVRIKVVKKPKTTIKRVKKDKGEEKKEEAPKFPYLIPYSKGNVNQDKCQGIVLNCGLFTQCTRKRLNGENGEGLYCTICQKQANESGNAFPKYGNVMQREQVGLMEYKDPNGRSPTHYLNVLKKKNISLESVIEKSNEFGIFIDPVHLVINEEPINVDAPKRRGRPKKKNTEVADAGLNEERKDIFAELIIEQNDNQNAQKAEKAELVAMRLADKESKAFNKEFKISAKKAELEAKKAEKEAKIGRAHV